MQFETPRLTVRRLTPEDAHALHAVLSDPLVMEQIEPPFTPGQTREFIAKYALGSSPLVYAVVWKDSGALIGHLIWHEWDDSSMELGWILRRDFWGKGVAKELTGAVLERAGRDVVIECSREQTAAAHIAESFGFRFAGADEDLLVYRKTIR